MKGMAWLDRDNHEGGYCTCSQQSRRHDHITKVWYDMSVWMPANCTHPAWQRATVSRVGGHGRRADGRGTSAKHKTGSRRTGRGVVLLYSR